MAQDIDDDPLSPFGALMDNQERALAESALAWSLARETGADRRQHGKQAFLATTFGVRCAPRGAPPEETLHSIKFLLFIFKLEDAPPALIDDLIAWTTGHRDASATEDLANLTRCHEGLVAGLSAIGRDPTGLEIALRELCASIKLEQLADKTAMTEEEYRRLRTVNVGVPAFIECWRTICGITFARGVGEALKRSMLLELASELAYLANDIGSLDKDEDVAQRDAGGVDLNFVRILVRRLGSRDAALAEAIALHNRRIEEFQRAERLLLESEHGRDRDLLAYLQILRATVDGNLATTRYLVPMRYRGAAEPLSRLASL